MFGAKEVKGSNFRDRLSLFKQHSVNIEVRLKHTEGNIIGSLTTVGDDFIDLQDDTGILTIPMRNIETVYFNKNIFNNNNPNI